MRGQGQVVRTKQGYSTEFEVKVGVHQGSVSVHYFL